MGDDLKDNIKDVKSDLKDDLKDVKSDLNRGYDRPLLVSPNPELQPR